MLCLSKKPPAPQRFLSLRLRQEVQKVLRRECLIRDQAPSSVSLRTLRFKFCRSPVPQSTKPRTSYCDLLSLSHLPDETHANHFSEPKRVNLVILRGNENPAIHNRRRSINVISGLIG